MIKKLYSTFINYWKKKAWFFMLIVAVITLILCWIFCERHNYMGSYDEFIVVDKSNYKKKEPYFPQSMIEPVRQSNDINSKIPKQSKGERICRDTLEGIFKKSFPNCRPDFLFNSVTGENLEYDMYNRDLKLAVEYNGQQHYKYNSFMHGNSKDKFYGQQYRDKMKKDISKKLGITLIEVPYTVKNEDIPTFLLEKLQQHNFI